MNFKEKKWNGNIICLGKVFFTVYGIMFFLGMRTSNVLSIVLAFLCYLLYRNSEIQVDERRRAVISRVTGSLFAVFLSLKGIQQFDGQEYSGIQKICIIVLVWMGFTLLFSHILYLFYGYAEKKTLQTEEIPDKYVKEIYFWKIMGVILLCWLPFYLLNFPGVVISDSCDQIAQGMNLVYSNHHPVVQTWIIQGIFFVGRLVFGSTNACVALYCCIQMVVLAAIYAWCVSIFYEKGMHKLFCRIAVIYFALMPYNIMCSFNMWKDTLFSAFFLLWTVILWKYLEKQSRVSIGEGVLCLLSGLGICLFRNNGFYAFLVCLPFATVLLWKHARQIVGVLWLTLALTLLVKGPIFQMYEVESPDMIESLSIPTQQIARVITSGGELTEEQRNLLGQVIDIDQIPEHYDSRISDPIKILVREKGNQAYLEEHKGAFLRLWLSLGKKYPSQYLRAYIDQTEGYWNPDIQRWQYTEGICETQIDIHTIPLLRGPVADLLWRYVGNWYTAVPIIGYLWSIGGMVWTSMIAAGVCVLKNRRKELLVFLPMLALWGTLMAATPVFAEFRYIYGIYLCLPCYIAAAFGKQSEDGALHENI